MYLFNSPQEFFDSIMWKGERFYDAKPYRKWFGWLYIALYDHIGIEEYKKDPNPDVQIKIGQSTNIFRRNKELSRDQIINGKIQKKASIVYAWSLPLSKRFESDLKTLLAAYIRPIKNRAGASEIIWGIPIVPLINIIQLSIFKTCVALKYIRTDMEFYLRPPDSILDGTVEYVGRGRYLIPHQLVLEDKFQELDIAPKGNTESFQEYIFLQDNRLDDVDDDIEETPVNIPMLIETQKPMYIETSQYMKGKVYPVGAYVRAKYVDPWEKSAFHLAQIKGYAGAEQVKNQYAVEWLQETEDNKPIRDEDGFLFTDDPWQYTTKVYKESGDILREFPELKTKQVDAIPKLRV